MDVLTGNPVPLSISENEIPFRRNESRYILRDIDTKLGGLRVVYQRDGDEHYLGLNTEAIHLFTEVCGGRWANSPDEALEGILNDLHERCVVGGALLIVDGYSENRRAFRVEGDADALVFHKVKSLSVPVKPQPRLN